MTHGTGWNPARYAAAHRELLATRRYGTVAAARSVRPAYCCSRFRWMFQGAAGLCYAHTAVAIEENTALAKRYPTFKNSRRMVAWVATNVIGPGGNPSDGGTITDALRAMTEPLGAGIAHEDLCPYSARSTPDGNLLPDDERLLSAKPGPEVFADARKTHLALPVPVAGLDEVRTLLDADHCVGMGIPWSYDWDRPRLFQEKMGPIEEGVGHALLLCGHTEAGVIHEEPCFRVDNWHSDRSTPGRDQYPALPPELAAKVPNYGTWFPGSDTASWWTESLLKEIFALDAPYELVSASDLVGASANVIVPSASGLFPV